MVGLIESERHITTQFFKSAGDVIILVGEIGHEMGATHFLKVCHGRKEGLPPRLDLARELAVQNSVREVIRAGVVRSAHDCSEGGLAVALAECCFNPETPLGAEIDLAQVTPADAGRPNRGHRLEGCATLFNESQSRIVISCAPNDVETARSMLRAKDIPHGAIGQVVTKTLRIKQTGSELSWSIDDLHDDWFCAIQRAVETETEPVRSL